MDSIDRLVKVLSGCLGRNLAGRPITDQELQEMQHAISETHIGETRTTYQPGQPTIERETCHCGWERVVITTPVEVTVTLDGQVFVDTLTSVSIQCPHCDYRFDDVF